MEDPIPVRPPLVEGFVHPSGEVHIQDSGAWLSCPGELACFCSFGYLNLTSLLEIGQDNPSPLCSTGDVKNIFDGNITNHYGPYDGVEMGC